MSTTPDQKESESERSKRTIQSALKQAWVDAREASAGIEEELRRRLRAVRERSNALRPEELQRQLTELRERFLHQRDEIERRVQESVGNAVERVRAPITDELASLRDRAERLSRRLESQLKRATGRSEEEGSQGEDAP